MKADRLLPILFLVAATCCFTQVIVESHVLSNCVSSDVVFLIDSSSSVSGSDFRRQLTFLRDVVDRLPIGPDTGVRVSVVTYGGPHPPQVHFPLHRHRSKAQLRDAVESIPQDDGRPRRRRKTLAAAAADAISLARRTVLLGGIPRRESPTASSPTAAAAGPAAVGRVIVVVLGGGGGRLADAAAARIEASAAKSDGVVVMGVEVGRRGVDGEEEEEEGKEEEEEGLKEIVSSPAERYTLGVADFADLAKIRDMTARKICEVKASAPIFSSGIASVSPSDILRRKESGIFDRTHRRRLPWHSADSKSYHQPPPPTHGGYFLQGRISRHAFANVTHPPQASTQPSKQDAEIPAVVPRPTEPVSSRTNAVLTAQALEALVSRPMRPTTLSSTSSTSLLSNEGMARGGGDDDELDSAMRPAPDPFASTELNTAERYKNGEEESPSTDRSASKSTVSHARSRDTGTSPPPLANTVESELDSYTQSRVGLSSIDDQSLLETDSEKTAVSNSNSSLGGTTDTDSVSSNDPAVTEEVNRVEALRRISDIRNVEHVSEFPTHDHKSNKDPKSHGTQRHRETAERHVAEYEIRDYLTSTDGLPTIRHQVSPSYRGYWKPDERGKLVHYREIRPGVFDKDGGPEFQSPRSETGGLRSPMAPATAQQQGRGKRPRKPSTRGNFDPWTSTGTGFGTKEGIYEAPPVGLSRGGGGDRPGSSQEVRTARNRSRSCDDPRHRTAPKATGFYRFSDGGKLVWQNFTASQLINQASRSSCRGGGETSAAAAAAQNPASGTIDPRPFRPETTTTTRSPARRPRIRARTTIPVDGPESSARRNHMPLVVNGSVVLPGPSGQVGQTGPDDVDKKKKNSVTEARWLSRGGGGGAEGVGEGHWRYDLSGRRVWIPHSPLHRETPPGIHRTITTQTPSNTPADPILERPSYGFWNDENGERVWYEYDPSSRRYRPVNDSTGGGGGGGGGQGSNKVRLELPPSLASVARSRINVTCRGCDVIVPLPGGDESSEEDKHFRFNSSSAIESPPPPPPPPDSVVSGLHRPRTPGLSRQHPSDPILDRGGQGEQKEKVSDIQVSKLLTAAAAAARPKRRRNQNRTTSGPGNDQHPEHSLKASAAPSSWDPEKPVKVCTARRTLSAAFMVDPRSLNRTQAMRLWQLAYEVVRRLRMDDGRVRIQFFPELQRRIVADDSSAVAAGEAGSSSSSSSSSAAHGDHTMMHRTADRKPVPDLLRSVADVLLNDSTGGVGGGGGEPSSSSSSFRKPDRRVIVYMTDGPSGSGVDGLRRAADGIRNRRGIEVFAVGLGQDTDLPELVSIADSSSSSSGRRRRRVGGRVFRLPNTDPLLGDVESLARELTFALCGIRPHKKSRHAVDV